MPKRVKINMPGFQAGEIELDGAKFVKGVSVDELSDAQIARIGGTYPLVDADGEDHIGPGADLVAQRAERVERQESLKSQEAKRNAKKSLDARVNERLKTTLTGLMSKGQLLEIADARGIQGLHVVAKQFSVEGNTIEELVEVILKGQEAALVQKRADLEKQVREEDAASGEAEELDEEAEAETAAAEKEAAEEQAAADAEAKAEQDKANKEAREKKAAAAKKAADKKKAAAKKAAEKKAAAAKKSAAKKKEAASKKKAAK